MIKPSQSEEDISTVSKYLSENCDSGGILKEDFTCKDIFPSNNVTLANETQNDISSFISAASANFSLEVPENINKNIILDTTNGHESFHTGSLAYSLDTTFSNNEEIYLMLQQYHNGDEATNQQSQAISDSDIQNQQIILNGLNSEFNGSNHNENNKTQLEIGSNKHNETKKTKNVRDERRRNSHNEIERKRRGKINALISQINALVPESFGSSNSNTSGNIGSKGKVLARIYDYMLELLEQHNHFEKIFKENITLKHELEVLQYHHQHCAHTSHPMSNNDQQLPPNIIYTHQSSTSYPDIVHNNQNI